MSKLGQLKTLLAGSQSFIAQKLVPLLSKGLPLLGGQVPGLLVELCRMFDFRQNIAW